MWRQTRRQWKRKPWISETSAGSWQLPRAYIRGACQCIYFIFFFSFSLVFVERGGKTQNWPRAAKRLEPAQSETMLAVEPTGVVSFCLFQWRHDKMDCWRRSNTNCSVSPTLLRTKQSLEIQTVLASYLNFLNKCEIMGGNTEVSWLPRQNIQRCSLYWDIVYVCICTAVWFTHSSGRCDKQVLD